MNPNVLLICTVGGAPEPLVASLKHWKPARVLFIPSQDSEPQIRQRILPLARAEGLTLSEGCYDIQRVSDPQSLSACVQKIATLTGEVLAWLGRGDSFKVVVDFTGGTKCMTAALALLAHRWACDFSYVGGTERTKNGLGIVVSGKESVLHTENPWNALGYQAAEDAAVFFDRGSMGAAIRVLDEALPRVSDLTAKNQIAALKTLIQAYAAWDRFAHAEAHRGLADALKRFNDLAALFPALRDVLGDVLREHLGHLNALKDCRQPTLAFVQDLLANARRCAAHQRYDDAVARLYRALEAFAQTRLRDPHRIQDTSHIPLDNLPQSMRDSWQAKAEQGCVRLGLQDAYVLLRELGDPLGEQFVKLELADRERSPLVARNQSILAHGFQPIGEKAFRALWHVSLELTQVVEDRLPRFPQLSANPKLT